MLSDLHQVTGQQQATADVCIVGAGPAGITLALKLAKAGKRVVLCEGGRRFLFSLVANAGSLFWWIKQSLGRLLSSL